LSTKTLRFEIALENKKLIPMKYLSFLFGCLITISSHAQSNRDSVEIYQLVNNVFLSLTKADSALFNNQFVKNPVLGSALRSKNGEVKVQQDSFADFSKAVGTPRKQVWIEEFWNLDIKVDGVFAQAWCDYAFYFDKRFSHCGIDAFQFLKTDQGWKIYSLIDTRRNVDCVVPEAIVKKYE
jgi:hypothetical protein